MGVDPVYNRRINDPIHGVISLSDVEIAVIETPIFQRLHNIYQLGLAHRVFPGANYSRFAHSLGACHIAGRLLNAINLNNVGHLEPRVIQVYRLAALLHDIGHYPFSHSMEHAIGRYYAGSLLAGSSIKAPREIEFDGLVIENEPTSYDHELMGKRLMAYDKQLTAALRQHGYSPEEVIEAFAASGPGSLIHLLSSDLDCDRLDYLMRTAHHAGMPYGAVDIDYIVSQASVDDGGIFCFRQQGLKAADHLLISRFFDYQQVPFHKTVVGLELLLEAVITGLFEVGDLNCSSSDMLYELKHQSWRHFDDQKVMQLFREFVSDGENLNQHQDLCFKIHSLLNRNPPRLLASFERLVGRDEKSDRLVYAMIKDRFRTRVADWATKVGIPQSRWFCWDVSFQLTKVGPSASSTKTGAAHGDDDEERAVRLLTSRASRGLTPSKRIMDFDQALMRPLSKQVYDAIRIYVLVDPNDPNEASSRASALNIVREEFSDIDFMVV